MYKENLEIEIKVNDIELNIVCALDWNGIRESDVYLVSIDNLPMIWFTKDFRAEVERTVIATYASNLKGNLEIKAESIGDELDRNN